MLAHSKPQKLSVPQSHTTMAAASVPADVLYDFTPLFKHYKNGRVEKLMGTEITPASLDQETGVQSKDVVISPDINLSARLFLPKSATPGSKLPLLVFFHGSAFVIESAFSPVYTRFLNLLVSKANVVAVSVNYRLAPEHPVPVAYDDSWLALKWIASQSKPGKNDEWINEFADFDRVYLGGDSAGANIAHNMAIRFGTEKLSGINIRGMFLDCPYFWGETRIGKEADYKVLGMFRVEDLWQYACPDSSGCDDPLMNPGMDPNISTLGCKRVLLYVGREDIFKDRGWYYKEVLEKSGWNGDFEIVDVEGEDHGFDVLNPTGENSIAIMKKVCEFLNQ